MQRGSLAAGLGYVTGLIVVVTIVVVVGIIHTPARRERAEPHPPVVAAVDTKNYPADWGAPAAWCLNRETQRMEACALPAQMPDLPNRPMVPTGWEPEPLAPSERVGIVRAPTEDGVDTLATPVLGIWSGGTLPVEDIAPHAGLMVRTRDGGLSVITRTPYRYDAETETWVRVEPDPPLLCPPAAVER